MSTLRYCKIRNVKSPNRGTPESAGIDFYVPEDLSKETFDSKCEVTKCHLDASYDENGVLKSVVLKPGESVMIPSGIKMKVPAGHALVMFNKSGVGAKRHLDHLAEVIDADYQGEVHLNLVNNGSDPQTISAGDKIIQGLILPVNFAMPEEVTDASVLYAGESSERGTGGFGSTGTK